MLGSWLMLPEAEQRSKEVHALAPILPAVPHMPTSCAAPADALCRAPPWRRSPKLLSIQSDQRMVKAVIYERAPRRRRLEAPALQ